MTYHSGHSVGVFIATLMLAASPAFAGYKCQNPSTSGASTSAPTSYADGATAKPAGVADCDVRYRDLELKYKGSALEKDIADCTGNCDDLRSIEGARSKDPLKHITTPLKSLVKNYSPYLYYSLSDEDLDKKALKVLDYLYRGTPGDTRKAHKMVPQKSADDAEKRYASCVDQIRTAINPLTKADWAKFNRLRQDNCANQYILYAALDPAYKEDTNKFSNDDPTKPSKKIGLYSHCQPLRMRPSGSSTMNEYHAADYIRGAWEKLLNNPLYRMTVGPVYVGVMTPFAPNKVNDPLPSKKEPGLPLTVTLADPIKPPSPLPDITSSTLMATPYEEIVDPSHPFTPRWDFKYTDRDLSEKTTSYGGDKNNEVFCAGDKDENIFKVDVLRFRDKKIGFTENMLSRIEFNKRCEKNTAPVANPCCTMHWTMCGSIPCPDYCEPHDCATCYQTDGADKPACSTNILNGTDRRKLKKSYMHVPMPIRSSSNLTYPLQYTVLAAQTLPDVRTASCDPLELRYNKDKVVTMCKKLRAPVVPINKLKMRYHNPDENESEIPSGAMEGMTFKEYFGDHMPYMRLHDTGQSIQEVNSDDQDPEDTKGQYTAIVGVGREGVIGGKSDERCLLGGWGGDTTFAGVSIESPDPITSWTELKLYQTRTARKDRVYCIGRYDKVFKPESSEEKILGAFGGNYQTLTSITDGGEANRITSNPWPLAFRGYFIETDEAKRFPNFGGSTPEIATGLDKAKPGDIILMPKDAGKASDEPGLPRLALVLEGSNNDKDKCEKIGNCWVKVAVPDNGNNPDICGSTDALGLVVNRYFYKPGQANAVEKEKNLYDMVGSDMNCADQNLQNCIFYEWNSAKRYDVRKDVRQGSSGGTP